MCIFWKFKPLLECLHDPGDRGLNKLKSTIYKEGYTCMVQKVWSYICYWVLEMKILETSYSIKQFSLFPYYIPFRDGTIYMFSALIWRYFKLFIPVHWCFLLATIMRSCELKNPIYNISPPTKIKFKSFLSISLWTYDLIIHVINTNEDEFQNWCHHAIFADCMSNHGMREVIYT